MTGVLREFMDRMTQPDSATLALPSQGGFIPGGIYTAHSATASLPHPQTRIAAMLSQIGNHFDQQATWAGAGNTQTGGK